MNNKIVNLLEKELIDLNKKKQQVAESNEPFLAKKKSLDQELINLKKEEKRITSELGHLTKNINTNFKKYNYFEELYQTKQLMLQNEKKKFFDNTNVIEYINFYSDSNIEDSKKASTEINEISTPKESSTPNEPINDSNIEQKFEQSGQTNVIETKNKINMDTAVKNNQNTESNLINTNLKSFILPNDTPMENVHQNKSSINSLISLNVSEDGLMKQKQISQQLIEKEMST